MGRDPGGAEEETWVPGPEDAALELPCQEKSQHHSTLTLGLQPPTQEKAFQCVLWLI